MIENRVVGLFSVFSLPLDFDFLCNGGNHLYAVKSTVLFPFLENRAS